MTTRGIVVMAKSPRPGQVKTRLCPPLSSDEAARLYDAFLRDTVECVRRVNDVELVVAYAPPEDRDVFAAVCGEATLLAQTDGDLGRRLEAVFDWLYARGFERMIAIGADTPNLPVELLKEAFALLDRPDSDVVLGPAADGGYYLIGFRTPHPEVFDGIPWSTPAVLAETKRRAEQCGFHVACLAPWWDVDTVADLTRLAASLRSAGGVAPHTRAVLMKRGLL